MIHCPCGLTLDDGLCPDKKCPHSDRYVSMWCVTCGKGTYITIYGRCRYCAYTELAPGGVFFLLREDAID